MILIGMLQVFVLMTYYQCHSIAWKVAMMCLGSILHHQEQYHVAWYSHLP